MKRPFRITVPILLAAVAFLVAGELATGTRLEFVAMMAGTITCIAVTFNLLGGLRTISGIAFTGLGLCTIVISQFAKIFFFEAADKNLEAPNVTIKVYLVFYFCLMLGTFVYGRVRIRLPRPMEPESKAQVDLQYAVSLVLGFVGSALFSYYESAIDSGGAQTGGHGLGLALSGLLSYAVVLAVITKIRETDGRHSFGIKVFLPWMIIVIFALIRTARGAILLPGIIYLVTCHSLGYRFKRKHYITGVTGLVLFIAFISPYEIYSRGNVAVGSFSGRVSSAISLFSARPNWKVIRQFNAGGSQSGSREEYYDRPGTAELSRISHIRADSNMISATSTGFHYGFTALKIEALHNVPHFLYPNKPQEDSAGYLGRVTGINPDYVENQEAEITAISDSYGAFSWLGVIVVGGLVYPFCFVLYESLFDLKKPWGVVALAGFANSLWGASMGSMLQIMTRAPLTLIALSYAMGLVISAIPISGDQRVGLSRVRASEN